MTKNRAHATPPTAATASGETNPFLAAFKSSLAKRWSLTGMAVLYEIADLVAFLYALGRDREAAAVANAVASGIEAPPPLPAGGRNYNIWCPATLSHAFLVHINAPSLSSRVVASREALLEDPGIARTNSEFIAARVSDASMDAAEEPIKKPTKAQRQQTARHLSAMVLYSVLANAGDAAFTIHRETAGRLVVSLQQKLYRLLTGSGA
jgi:hypothetical protein